MDFLTGLFVGYFALGWIPMIIITIYVTGIFACIEYDRGVMGLIITALTWTALFYLFDVNLFAHFWSNPFDLLIYSALYLAIGIVYSFFRWDRHVATWRRRYDHAPDSEKILLAERIPEAKHKKDGIFGWMMFWPWSAFWWILSDFLKEVFQYLWRKLGRLYNRITERHTKGIPISDRD